MNFLKYALFWVSAAACLAQPVISNGGIVNAASWAPAGLPNSSIAQGSIFIIAGTNLGPTTLTLAPAKFPLPTTVANVSVNVNMASTNTAAILFWVRNDYIAALLPSTVPVGTGTVTVTYNGQTSNAAPITVVANSIGIFAIGQNGQGPGVITDGAKPQTSVKTELVTQTNSAKAGDTLVAWVTGVGAVPWDETEAPPSTPLNLQSKLNASVYVGTTKVTPTYAGPSGCCEGEGQVQFVVPSGISGCYVPITIVVGSQVSNTVTTAIDASGKTCSDQFGFSSEELTKIQNGGTLRTGVLDLNKTQESFAGQSITNVSAFGTFQSYTAANFTASAGQFPTLNTCVVNPFTASTGIVTPGFFTGLDAGSSIALTGPNGDATLTPITDEKGFYTADLAPTFLDANTGSFVFSGTGGADVGAFTATLPAAPPLTWTNETSIGTNGVVRSQGVQITWSGGDPTGFVEIEGFSQSDAGNGANFLCIAKNSLGQFTVPSWVTGSLPASSTSVSGGQITVLGTSKFASFTATGIDAGFVFESSGASSAVTFQ